MTAEMRMCEERFGVCFVDILSLCLRTQSMLGGALKGLRRGLLQACLNCLVKVIERLLCSSTTSSMSFSWRLPRGLYPSEERSRMSSSSMGGESGKMVVYLPMKVLDDLSICEQRAVLRAETQLSSKPTVHQEAGKVWWSRKRERHSRLIHSILTAGGKDATCDIWLEHSVGLMYEGRVMQINLSGLVDVLIFYSVSCRRIRVPVFLLFEFTLHREVGNTADRVIAYSSATHTKYGFPVIPTVIVMKDADEDLVEKFVLMLNNDRLGLVHLNVKMRRLEELLSGRIRPRHASHEVCLWCDTELRRRCIYYL